MEQNDDDETISDLDQQYKTLDEVQLQNEKMDVIHHEDNNDVKQFHLLLVELLYLLRN